MTTTVMGRFDEQTRIAHVSEEVSGLIFESFGEVFPVQITDKDQDSGTFYELNLDIPSGKYVIIPHLAMPNDVGIGGAIRVSLRGPCHGTILNECLEINSIMAAEADSYLFKFEIFKREILQFHLHSSRIASRTYLRYLEIHIVHSFEDLTRASFDHPFEMHLPELINEVLIGTTSVCNASCIHCPTNKKMLSHLPSGTMTWEMYERIILGLKEYGRPVNKICFGLFAEPLNDPLLFERLKFAREHLPNTYLEMATNAAAYDETKHPKEIFDFLDRVAVHIEAVTPAIYNEIMHPLKKERAFPKIEKFVSEAKKKVGVWITTPIHKMNISEVPALRSYAEELGIPFSSGPTANRCTSSLVYDRIKFAPQAATCREDIMDNLIIDWDGSLLSCCIDFQKRTLLGDLGTETIAEAFLNQARNKFGKILKNGYWSKSESCRNCVADDFGAVQKLIDELPDQLATVSEGVAECAGVIEAMPDLVVDPIRISHSRSWSSTALSIKKCVSRLKRALLN